MATITTASGETYYATRDSSGVYHSTGRKVQEKTSTPETKEIASRIQRETYSNDGRTFRGTGQSTAKYLPTDERDLPPDQSATLTPEEKRQAVLKNRQTTTTPETQRQLARVARGEQYNPLDDYEPKDSRILRGDEIKDARQELGHAQISAVGNTALVQGYSTYRAEEIEKFNKKWDQPEYPEEQYAKYEKERAELEKRVNPLGKRIEQSRKIAITQAKKSIDLADQINRSEEVKAKMDYYTADEKAVREFTESQTGQGYVGGIAKVTDRDLGAGVKLAKIELSEPAKVIALDTLAGATVGTLVAPGVGTLTGAIGGASVALGDLSFRYTTLGSEQANLPIIGQSKRRVEVYREPTFTLPIINRKVYTTPDLSQKTRSTVEPIPEFESLLSQKILEGTSEGIKVDPKVLDSPNYRLVSKSEDLSERVRISGELGSIAGMILAPEITKFGTKQFRKYDYTTTKAVANIEYREGKEYRELVSQTTRKNIFGETIGKVGSRKVTGQLGEAQSSQGKVKLGDVDATVKIDQKVFGGAKRTGSPIKATAEAEVAQGVTVGDDKAFYQAFKTSTATPEGTSSAYGVGSGAKVGDITLGKNIGVSIYGKNPPGFYELVYKVKGVPSTPDLSGGWTPTFNPQSGTTQLSSGLQKTLGSTVAPTIPQIDVLPKALSSISTTAGSTTTTSLKSTPANPGYISSMALAEPEQITIQRTDVKEKLTPAIQVAKMAPRETEVVRVRGVESVQRVTPLVEAVMVSRSGTRTQEATVTITETVPAIETIEETQQTPALETPGFSPIMNVPRIPSPGIPPVVPLIPPINIPLGRWDIGVKPRVRGQKRRTPRYAPSVTASVFKITTPKPQKATGWTGLEIRPLVVSGIKKKKTKKKKKKRSKK